MLFLFPNKDVRVLERRAEAVSLAHCQGPYGLSELPPTGTTPAEQQRSQRFFKFISSVTTAFNIFITGSCGLIWPFDLTFANLPLGSALLSVFAFLYVPELQSQTTCCWAELYTSATQREQLNTMEWELEKTWIAPIMARRHAGS